MTNSRVLIAKPAPRRLCAFLGLLFLLLISIPASGGDSRMVRVRFVADGDTCVLEDGETVRLWGIDAPEISHDGAPSQYWGEQAREELASLITGQEIILEPAPGKRDHYGRTLGLLRLPDGRCVNGLLLQKGAAFLYPHPPFEGRAEELMERFLDIQRSAMEDGAGMWHGVRRHLELKGAVRGNRRSLRFFSPGCDGHGRIALRNRVEFASSLEAFFSGYAPARHCGIWPEGHEMQ